MNVAQISEEDLGGVLALALAGRLDGAGGPMLECHGLARIAEGRVRLLLDFERVVFVSSAGLRAVLTLAKAVDAAGGTLAICALQPVVAEIFCQAGFDAFLTIKETRDQVTGIAGTKLP